MATTISYDLTYESDSDGTLRDIASVDAHGHLEDREVEVFLADVVTRELDESGYYDEPLTFGLEVEHLHRIEVPVPADEDEGIDAHTVYAYLPEPDQDSIPVTRFQIASPWTRRGTDEPLMCIHHPEEPAAAGLPESWFSDAGEDIVIDGHIHYCAMCAALRYAAREDAIRQAMAEQKAAAA